MLHASKSKFLFYRMQLPAALLITHRMENLYACIQAFKSSEKFYVVYSLGSAALDWLISELL